MRKFASKKINSEEVRCDRDSQRGGTGGEGSEEKKKRRKGERKKETFEGLKKEEGSTRPDPMGRRTLTHSTVRRRSADFESKS